MTLTAPRALVLLSAVLLAAALPAGAAPTPRARDLGIQIGHYPPGRWNAITDVAGVRVGHTTVTRNGARTGVTAIVPREDVWTHKCFAGSFVLNGNGEVTGLSWIRESGWLEVPILLTETLSVPRVADGVVSWMLKRYPRMGNFDDVVLPVVGECDDQFLNDQRARHIQEADVFAALDGAAAGPVAEGGVGAGTGMVSYRFKGGIGTASRVLPRDEGGYTVGVLVNANMGARRDLRIDGVPVGASISGWMPKLKPSDGSIIMIVATDAPLLPHQLNRLAARAALGLARTGSPASHGSGDFMLAFSTAADVPHAPEGPTMPVTAMVSQALTPLFDATVECAEEAIVNALVAGRTTVGREGHTVYGLPHDELKKVMAQYGRLAPVPAR